jgi:3-ketosteroid 9alpha-monooxygenase subunit A
MPVVRFPMQSYPTSWYRVAESTDVAIGQIRRLHYFGRDLIAYRSASGQAHVADAYCPHLGANIAVGGKIENDAVVCPFHGWRFDATGNCVDIHYADRIPAGARLRVYPVMEFDGVIAIYYDELGREPEWRVPELGEHEGQRAWTPFARRTWKIRTHVQEILENGPDVAHQVIVHNAISVPDLECTVAGTTFTGRLSGKYDYPGAPPGGISVTGEFINIGMGFTHMQIADHMAGQTISRQVQFCWTPIDDELVEASIAQRIPDLGDPAMTEQVRSAIVLATYEDFERDIPIWENKIYRSLPARARHGRGEQPSALCEGEGDIARFRNWSRQFYTDEVCGV